MHLELIEFRSHLLLARLRMFDADNICMWHVNVDASVSFSVSVPAYSVMGGLLCLTEYLVLRVSRLQHQVNLLQQQLTESRQLLHSLQCELQVFERVCATKDLRAGEHQTLICHFWCQEEKLKKAEVQV